MTGFDIPEKSKWTVQLLTREYLIEGTIDGNKYKLGFQLFMGDTNLYALNNASFRPTGNLSVPARSQVPWTVVYGSELIGVIPKDEASTAYAIKANSTFTNPVPAEIFAGPYSIKGTMLTQLKDILGLASSTIFAARDVEINCLLPHAQLTGFKVPYILLTGRNVQMATPYA